MGKIDFRDNGDRQGISKILKKIQCCRSGRIGHLDKEKCGFIKNHVTGDDDSVGNRIKTHPVSFVMIEIPEKDTGCVNEGQACGQWWRTD